jgi:hypothetical protein
MRGCERNGHGTPIDDSVQLLPYATYAETYKHSHCCMPNGLTTAGAALLALVSTRPADATPLSLRITRLLMEIARMMPLSCSQHFILPSDEALCECDLRYGSFGAAKEAQSRLRSRSARSFRHADFSCLHADISSLKSE